MVRAVGAALAAAISILLGPSNLGGGTPSGTLRGAEGFDGFDLATWGEAHWGDARFWGSEEFWPVEPEEEVDLDVTPTVRITFGPKASEAQPEAPATDGPAKEEPAEPFKPTANAEGAEPDEAEPNSSWSSFGGGKEKKGPPKSRSSETPRGAKRAVGKCSRHSWYTKHGAFCRTVSAWRRAWVYLGWEHDERHASQG